MLSIEAGNRYVYTSLSGFKRYESVTMNFHPRHGTVIGITAAEKERLVNKWMKPGKRENGKFNGK
jgi:hypothetical protein